MMSAPQLVIIEQLIEQVKQAWNTIPKEDIYNPTLCLLMFHNTLLLHPVLCPINTACT